MSLFPCLSVSRALLILQGKSADLAKRAIPSVRKQRVLLTFGKSQPKKPILPPEGSYFTSTTAPPPSPWGGISSPVRPSNLPRPKHFGALPSTGVLPAPSVRPPHALPANGIQPLFVGPSPAPPATVAYPAPPPSPGWVSVAPPPRHSAPRLPIPGTGVFLPPPGSSPPAPVSPLLSVDPNSSLEPTTALPIGNSSPQTSPENGIAETENGETGCNGSSNSAAAKKLGNKPSSATSPSK